MTRGLVAAPLALFFAQAPVSNGYRVGPGDVLEISVAGRPELARLPTVQTTGSIFLPLVGELDARGLTTDEIAARIARSLVAADPTAARVSVRVHDYQSQFVWVRGALNRPGRQPLRGGTRLVDALLDAGGFNESASGAVVLRRSSGFADGERERRFHFSAATSSAESLAELTLPLVPGDVIEALGQTWVIVSGAVRRPGRYRIETATTVRAAIEAAGGLLRAGSDRVSLLRSRGGSVEVDLDAIRGDRADDPLLGPDDEVRVKARRW